jgi:hypothetical protein
MTHVVWQKTAGLFGSGGKCSSGRSLFPLIIHWKYICCDESPSKRAACRPNPYFKAHVCASGARTRVYFVTTLENPSIKSRETFTPFIKRH